MIKRGMPHILAGLALFAAGMTAQAIRAADLSPPSIERLRVGFDGQYKVAHWTPVELTLLGGAEQIAGMVHLIVPDGDGTPSEVTSPRPVLLLPGRRTTVLLYVKFGASFNEMRILFRADGHDVIDVRVDSNSGGGRLTLPVGTDAGQRLIVTLGASIGVEEAARQHQVAGGEAVTLAHLHDANDLPTEWYGYDGVDWLVISTSGLDTLAKMLDTGARRAALVRWVEQGGKLALTVGAQAPSVLAPDAPLAPFAVGRFAESTTLRRTTSLEGYVGGSKKVPITADELKLSVPRLENVKGRIEVAEGNLPLIVRAPRRFGQVLFIAVDLDRKPFTDWEGRGNLVARLLGLAEPGTTDTSSGANQSPRANSSYGWDLAGNMRRGLDDFTGITPISFAVVAVLILGYIVLIGPGDYFLVRKALKRMELTWITFPLWVVLVSAGAYALAVYTKGHELRLNQVDLVDVDTDQGWARGTTWLNLFTPQSQSFDLALEPQEPSGGKIADSRCLLAWLGSGEANFGGRAGGLFSGQYAFAPQLDALAHVPIQVWSTKSFFNRAWYQQREMPSAEIVISPDGVPGGTLHNDLPIPLTNCMLLCGRWAYVLGALQPQETVRLKSDELRDLEHVLRRADASHNGATAPRLYATSGDVLGTLEQMMFFKAAGDRTAEGATNGNQSFVDMSDLLTLDRAILLAYAERPAAQLTRDGRPLVGTDDRHWTVYRFVFPVKKAKGKNDRD